MQALTNADDLTLVDQDGPRNKTVGLDRWQNYGKDRLYVNGDVQKADKYSLHVDLQANEVVSDNESAHGGSVEVDGDTATVTLVSKVGLDDTEYVLTFDVEWGDD